jgi:deazaflavin-dependent oxidoreductase (nitroreductase family)
MALRRTKAVEWFWRLHVPIYRASGGRLLGRVMGMPVLLLDTVGRKSGQRRTNALTWFPKGSDFVVIASVLGEPRDPGWWLNLSASPETTVQVGRERIAVRAREAEGGEREQIWSAVVAQVPEYDEYRARTARRIPVVVLERRAASR